MFLTETADLYRHQIISTLPDQHRSEFGQYFTPGAIARFMAAQFGSPAGHLRLLDPGAGVGTLTAAFVEQLLKSPDKIQHCSLTVYEIEPTFLPALKQRLIDCCSALEQAGIQADYCLHTENFIQAAVHDLLTSSIPFTHAILNPPYRKIHSQSAERASLTQVGIETTNLYSAFVWLAMRLLEKEGELVAITPRSFCNGTYFRPFRKAFFQEMKLDTIHIFQSRSAAFSEDSVLQENIIFRAVKTTKEPETVTITSSSTDDLEEGWDARQVAYQTIIDATDSEQFIYISTSQLDDTIRIQCQQFPATLEDLGLEISTGSVVDFRLKFALRNTLSEETVPLLYPESIQNRAVFFPPKKPRKAIAIQQNQDTQKWLIQPGWYVLVKRFSAKEEKRRVVAAVCPPLDAPALGIENHLNYYHAHGQGINPDLARGLAAFLNSTLVDQYFRQFSGHTQVNATDLRYIKYPQRKDLIRLGQQIKTSDLDQDRIDSMVHQVLSIQDDAVYAVQAIKRRMSC